MQHILQAIRVTESSPGSSAFAYGVAQPTDRPLAVPAPPMPGPVAHETGHATVEPVAQDAAGLALASVRLIRALWPTFPRHALETVSHDAEQVERRRAWLRRVLDGLPAEVPADVAPFVVGAVGHLVIGGLGLAVEDAVSALARTGEEANVERWIRDAIEGGTWYEHDSIGRELDAHEARRREEAAQRSAAEAAKAAEEAAPANETADEHDWLVIEVDPRKLPTRQVLVHGTGRMTAELVFPSALAPLVASTSLERDGKRYFFIPRWTFGHAKVPTGRVALGVRVLDGAFVIPASRPELAKLSAAVDLVFGTGDQLRQRELITWLFTEVRPSLDVDPNEAKREVEYDETTPDGRHRVQLFEAAIREEHLRPLAAERDWGWCVHFIFDAGTRGLSLADDVVASKLHRMLRDQWRRIHVKPAHWDATEAAKQKTTRTENGSPYKAQAWTPPPMPRWCSSEAAILEKWQHIAKNAKPFFVVDELYEAPEPGILDRLKAALTVGDDWGSILRGAVEGFDTVSTVDLENALRAAGEIGPSPSNAQRVRIQRAMTKLGWTYDKNTAGKRRWRKTPGAEKWAKP